MQETSSSISSGLLIASIAHSRLLQLIRDSTRQLQHESSWSRIIGPVLGLFPPTSSHPRLPSLHRQRLPASPCKATYRAMVP